MSYSKPILEWLVKEKIIGKDNKGNYYDSESPSMALPLENETILELETIVCGVIYKAMEDKKVFSLTKSILEMQKFNKCIDTD